MITRLGLSALISVLLCATAYGTIGAYFVDLGTRTRTEFCDQLLTIYRQYDKLTDAQGACVWFKPEQQSQYNNPTDRITIEMHPIHGTIYSIYYDLPSSVDSYAWSSFLARSGENLLSGIGVTKDGYTGIFAKAQQAQDAEQEAKHNRGAPPCNVVLVTGYAAVYPNNLERIYASPNARDLLAYNPLQCETVVRAGHEFQGATIGGSQITQCKGITWLEGKLSRVADWSKDMIRVSTEIDFDTGRRPVALFVRRQDAICRN